MQVGYVVQVTGAQLSEDLLQALPDFERRFEGQGDNGMAIYYTCDTCLELDEAYGDMLYKVQDLEVWTEARVGDDWWWCSRPRRALSTVSVFRLAVMCVQCATKGKTSFE